MTDATPLDPDQIPCRRCHVAAGVPCQTPSGKRATTVHAQRRRDARDGRTPDPTRPNPDPGIGSTEARRKGQATQAQRRRQRAQEIAAAEEAERDRIRREAAEQEAAELAADAVRYERDRRTLRRKTLDAATKAYDRLLEGLDGIQRVEVDSDGRPLTTPVERTNRSGDPITVEVPDIRGAYSASHVERLSKVAAQSLLSLRLEEEKPTGITRNESGEPDPLEGASLEELLAWRQQHADP